MSRFATLLILCLGLAACGGGGGGVHRKTDNDPTRSALSKNILPAGGKLEFATQAVATFAPMRFVENPAPLPEPSTLYTLLSSLAAGVVAAHIRKRRLTPKRERKAFR